MTHDAYRKALDAPPSQATVIGTELVRQAVEASRTSPRRRIILPLHKSPDATLHRMLNAIQPYSYIQAHRHLHPPKPESIIVLQGAIITFVFGETGQVEETAVLAAGTAAFGIDFEPGVLHTFFALQPDTVLFEVKPGPYEAQTDKDFAPWAAAENSPEAGDYMANFYEYAGKFGWPVPDRD